MKVTLTEDGRIIVDGEGNTVIYGQGLPILEGFEGRKFLIRGFTSLQTEAPKTDVANAIAISMAKHLAKENSEQSHPV